MCTISVVLLLLSFIVLVSISVVMFSVVIVVVVVVSCSPLLVFIFSFVLIVAWMRLIEIIFHSFIIIKIVVVFPLSSGVIFLCNLLVGVISIIVIVTV